jgi:hypothetical protein
MSWEGGNRRFSCFYLVQSNPSGIRIDNNIKLTNKKDRIRFCLIFLFVNPTTATNTLDHSHYANDGKHLSKSAIVSHN